LSNACKEVDVQIILLSLFLIAMFCPIRSAFAADAGPAVADAFYMGKTIKLMVGFRPGAAYDLYARLAARHIGRYIPGNPAVVVENSVESAAATAGGIYRAGPDGTTLAALIPALYLTQLTGSGDALPCG